VSAPTTSKQRVAKLEKLLERVLARAAEPRPVQVIAATPAPSHTADGGAAHAVEPSPPPKPVEIAKPAPPPLPPPPAPEPEPLEVDLESLPEPVIELPRKEVAPPMEALQAQDDRQSIERLKTSPPAAGPSEAEPTLTDDAPHLEVSGEVEAVEVSVEEVEVPMEEPAPSSSRRPLTSPPMEKPLEELAFGEEQPPAIHTPPPESGKLPAAPELVEFDTDTTGVRDAQKAAPPPLPPPLPPPVPPPLPARALVEPMPAPKREPIVAAPPPLPPPPQAPPKLEPVLTRATLEASAPVADVVGKVAAFEPATFGDLLDATLSL
jgi:hypothetical protein